MREARIFKYGIGHGLELLRPARRERAALRRRQVVRADVVPEDRRPRGGRHQVRRHHAPRGEDGRASISTIPTSLEFIDWKVVEEQKVAALVAGSRLARRRLQAILEACHVATDGAAAHRHEPEDQRGTPRRAARSPRGHDSRGVSPAHAAPRRAGRRPRSSSPSTTRTGTARRTSRSPARTRTTAVRVPNEFFDALATRTASGCSSAAPTAQPSKKLSSARALERDRLRRLGVRRPGPAVRHHDQRVAHLPAGRPHQREQPVRDGRHARRDGGWLAPHRRAGRPHRVRVIGADGLPHLVTRVFPTGRKPVFDLTTRAGLSRAHHRRSPRAHRRTEATWRCAT